jgi:hypothetical protein
VIVVGLIHVDIDYFRVHIHVNIHSDVLIILIEGRSALTSMLM